MFNKSSVANAYDGQRVLGYSVFNISQSLEKYVELEKEKLRFEIHKHNILNSVSLVDRVYETDFFEK